MLIREKTGVPNVHWGNGQSYRFLLQSDDMGFTLAHTVVTAGTSSPLQYRRHLEACYCISGRGAVELPDGTRHEIAPGTLYALNDHDAHFLIADPDTDLELISVFNPPLRGDERHSIAADGGFSQY